MSWHFPSRSVLQLALGLWLPASSPAACLISVLSAVVMFNPFPAVSFYSVVLVGKCPLGAARGGKAPRARETAPAPAGRGVQLLTAQPLVSQTLYPGPMARPSLAETVRWCGVLIHKRRLA